MIFSIVIILVIALVAYMHMLQGLFSATISAICAVFAAVIAISYHENLINMLFKGAMANQAQAMAMCGLFALSYILLKTVFDKAIPGNVRYPVLMDKVGALLMGLVAGIFSVGVFAMAVQSLPFGPSILGFSRYNVDDHPSKVPGARGQQDSMNFAELKDDALDANKLALDPAKQAGMLFPVDEYVLGMTGRLSGGALSGDRPLQAVHPDWLGELFGQRLGVQSGTKHVLVNLPALQTVSLKDLFRLDSVQEIDGENKLMRINETLIVPEKGDTLKASANETLLVARIYFDLNGSDPDSKIRVSCASVRLVGWEEKDGSQVFVNYNPIGTLEDSSVLYRNKPDDPLILAGNKAADFVFKVPRAAILKDLDPKAKEITVKPGVFIEVKRMAKLDLTGQAVKGAPVYSKDVEVMRKTLDQAKGLPKRGQPAQSSAAEAPAAEGPIVVSDMEVNNKIFSPLNPGTYSGDPANVTIGASGNGVIHDKKFQKLVVNATQTLALISTGDFATRELYAPDGKKTVQVTAKPQTGNGADPWAWAGALGQFELVDGSGAKYKPNGAVARVKASGGPDRMVANYDAANEVGSVDKAEEGRAYDVYILFNVPSGTQITQLQYQGNSIATRAVAVP